MAGWAGPVAGMGVDYRPKNFLEVQLLFFESRLCEEKCHFGSIKGYQ
jgi:hypothetical protein